MTWKTSGAMPGKLRLKILINLININIQKYCLGLVYRRLLQRFLAAGGNISYYPGYFFNYRLKKKACSWFIIYYKNSHILPFRKIQNPIYKVDKTIASR